LYLDASGTPEVLDTGEADFVLLGSIQESSWFALEKRVADLSLPSQKRHNFRREAPT
jgi:hypothetical protein